MISLFLLATLITVSAQSVINTLQSTYQQNYIIGYSNNSCVRIAMFKFQALTSGTGATLSLKFVQEQPPVNGTNTIGLYNVNGIQNGRSISNTFYTNQDTHTYNLMTVNWTFVSGSSYYVSIETPDNLRIPWSMSSGSTSANSLTLQHAPLCNATQWITDQPISGTIPVLINVTSQSVTPTRSPIPLITSLSSTSTSSKTPSSTISNSPTSSPTTSPTPTYSFPSNTGTGTPTPTPTNLLDAANQTNTAYATYTMSAIPYSTFTLSATPYSTFTLSATTYSTYSREPTPSSSAYSSPSSTQVSSINNQPAPSNAQNTNFTTLYIAGYTVGFLGLFAVVFVVLQSCCKKLNKSPLTNTTLSLPNPNDAVIAVSPINTLKEQTVTNLEQPQINSENTKTNELPTNHWYRVVDDGDTYYFNNVTKVSEWLLPADGIIIGEGVPGN